MNFNIEIAKMLEVISKEPQARRFAYVIVLCIFFAVIWWRLPEILQVILLK